MKTSAAPRLSLVLPTGFLLFLGFLTSCQTMDSKSDEGVMDQASYALVDIDGDGRVSLSDLAKYKHREGLAEVDTDGDKAISILEWKAAKPSDPANDEQFHRLDKNDDKQIEEKEAVEFLLTHSTFPDAFKVMERNADGFLLWEEYSVGDPSTLDVMLFAPNAPTE